MSKTRLFILTAVTVFALVGATAAIAGMNRNFVAAPLKGSEENPPVDTRGTGVAKLHLDKEGEALHFKLNVANLTDIVQAHIHCGADGVNGPVVAFLYGAGPIVTTQGTLSEGTITDANVIDRPSSPECPGGIADFDDLIEKIRSGDAYVNVHTSANPTGEIRAQLK
jgi:hypothetical protein